MFSRLRPATASALLFAAVLVLVCARIAGVGSNDSSSSAVGLDPSVVASPAEPTPPAGATGRPRAAAQEPAAPQRRRPSKPRPGATTPHPDAAEGSFLLPLLEPDSPTPPWYGGLVDVREPQDHLVAGVLTGPHALPDEVDEPPPGLVEPPPPPAPPPVVADDLQVGTVGPFSATVRFTTDQEVAGVVGFGWDEFGWDGPVSYASAGVGRTHRVELRGLIPDTEYRVQVVSHTGEVKPELSFTTEPRALSPHAGIDDGRIELDGQPFFPVTAYGACPWTLENLLRAGVNVFKWEHSCGSDEADVRASIAALDDRAYWTLPWADRKLATDGLIGYTQLDEPDGLGLHPSELPDIHSPGKVTFLTLTQHFAPGTGEFPWQYPGYYEGFMPKADVLGVDFYPLQSLCSPEKLALNHDIQVELIRMARGRPTIQWIEAAEMKCPERADAAITPATIRAEMLLALAGGANGLGIFPARVHAWAPFVIRNTLDTIEQGWPMLMTPRIPVEIDGDGASVVRASARLTGGGTMIVVANSSPWQSASVELQLPGIELDGLRFRSADTPLEVSLDDQGLLKLALRPLEAHVLVAGPAGYDGEPEDDTEADD